MKRVGFIGLGAMGAPMAWNIHKGGFALSVYNRTASRTAAFADAGIAVCGTPRELAAASELVIIMVTDPAALDAVLRPEEGILAGLQRGTLVVNTSTVSREATCAAAESVTAAGGRFLDAPVSGTVKPAEDGALVILAGGDAQDLEAARPVLLTLGKTIIACGDVGQGTGMKLVLNLLLGTMMEALAEALTLGGRLGLEATAILEALAAGPMNAPLYQMKGAMMGRGDFSRQFPVRLMHKDLSLVLAAAGKAGIPLPVTAATREVFTAAEAQGLGDEDMAAVIEVLRTLGRW